MSFHILVLGSTGTAGLDFCTAALAEDHQLTLYVRNPTKLPSEISSNPKVTVLQGSLDDIEGLKKVTASGATIFVSFAGPVASSKGTPVTDAMKLLFPLLIQNNFKRALVLGTCSFPAPQDNGGLKWKASIVLIKIIGGSAYEEFNGLGSFVTSQDVNKLRWTLFRVPFLRNGEAKPVTATYTGSGKDGMFMNRKSLVFWVLKEMNEGSEWVGKAPVLSN